MQTALHLSIATIIGAVVALAIVIAVNGGGLPAGQANAVDTVTPRPTRTPEGQTPPPVTPSPSPSPVPTASPSPTPSPTPAPETLFANVHLDGTLGNNHGAVSVAAHTANSGEYVITWDRSIQHCGAVAAPGLVGENSTGYPGYAFSYINGSFETLTVDVYYVNSLHDSAFSVIVAC